MNKNELPKISDAEWKVMEVLWDENPLSSQQIVEKLSDTSWNPKTIKTLIFRLEKKQVISHHKEKREHLYFPLLEREPFVREESKSLLDKLFGGATAPLVAHFLKKEKLSSEELAEIKKLIDSMEDQ